LTFRDRLRAASPTAPLVGTWVKLPCIESVELLALGGIELVAIDAEHGTLDPATASPQLAIARARGIASLVRCPHAAAHEVTRFVDAGADGIIFPHIDDAATARAAAHQLSFEPDGTRGMGISSRAGDWGLHGTAAYLDNANRPAAIAMIESPAGVNATASIVTETGIDAVLIGPADLAVSLGCGGDVRHVAVDDAIKHVVEATRSAGIPCGIAVGTAEDAKRFSSTGFAFFLVSNDATLLGRAAAEMLRSLSSFAERSEVEGPP
jgi:4-hydroxy-2-oxoheptanedioate aldolase